MKDEVIKSKPTIHSLPGADFRYGKPETKDSEGVYERNPHAVTHHWQVHTSTSPTDPEKDYQRLNAMSVAQRFLKPRAVAEFRKRADVRVQRREGTLPKPPKLPSNLRFGVPSEASDSMKEIMTNGCGNAAAARLRLNYLQESREKSSVKPRTLCPWLKPAVRSCSSPCSN